MAKAAVRGISRRWACIRSCGMVTNTRRLVWISLAVILLVIAVCTKLPAESDARDDGWRRTAQGWERLVEKRKITPAETSFSPRPKSGGSPVHPLLFAAAQVGLIAAAYWRLPVKT